MWLPGPQFYKGPRWSQAPSSRSARWYTPTQRCRAKSSCPPTPIAVGDPLQVYAPGDEGLPEAIRSANFAQTAFGVQTAWEDRIQRYRETAEVRAEEFGSHLDDTVLEDSGER